jgi:hypothetical protein
LAPSRSGANKIHIDGATGKKCGVAAVVLIPRTFRVPGLARPLLPACVNHERNSSTVGALGMDAAGGRALGGDDETAPSGAIGARSNSVRQGWWGAIVGRAASVLRRGKNR